MGPMKSGENRPESEPDRHGAAVEPPVVRSDTLLAGHRQLVIVHNDERYVLRVTRQGKLILNK